MITLVRVFIAAAALSLIQVWGQPLLPDAGQRVKASLILSHTAARPGDTITAALRLEHAPGWHTYWRNPGDAGLPTSVDWSLPEGLSLGDFEWPVPEKLLLIRIYSYAYEGETLLLMPLTIASDAPAGDVILRGKASWLQCSDELCQPAGGDVQASLTIGSEAIPSSHAPLIEQWKQRLPVKDAALNATAHWLGDLNEDQRPLVIEWNPRNTPGGPDFFPYESDEYNVHPQTEVLQASSAIATIRKGVSISDGEWPKSITGLLIDNSSESHPAGYEVTLEIPEAPLAAGAIAPSSAPPAPAAPFADVSILVVLGFAFLGGLILNVMPCVLPVIALKVLSFVNQSGSEPGRARQLGLVYALGVLASFLVLAGIVIGVQRAGGIASWGMQFQNPVFLVAMITLLTLISLNLFGVFEITLGGRTLGAASEFASREGSSGAFFHGILTTVLGTSCTAPFLAFAIGYALAQPPLMILLVFAVMGAGLAFPYVVLTWNPALLRLLPRPGPWMLRFKVAMGFPMLATAVWLFSVAVTAHFTGPGAFWLAMFLVVIGFAAWVWGEFIQRGTTRKPLAAAIAFASLALAVGYILEQRLQWRDPIQVAALDAPGPRAGGIQWQKWSHDAVAEARAQRRPVLVDFTAAWCPTCIVNKATSIEIESVREKLREINAVALIGDFTRQDPEIARELQRFQRGAVPLVLVYPADPAADPIVLPPTLTPGIVLEALQTAAGSTASAQASAPVANRRPRN